jgi:hypothetical protein
MVMQFAKKAIELLDAVTSVPYSTNGLRYRHGLVAILPFTCYSYWFSCYFDLRGKLMKALARAFHLKLCTYVPLGQMTSQTKKIGKKCLFTYGQIAQILNYFNCCKMR